MLQEGPCSASAPSWCRRGKSISRVSWGMSRLTLKQQRTQNLFWRKAAQVSVSHKAWCCSLIGMLLSPLFNWQRWKCRGSTAPRDLHVHRRRHNLNPPQHEARGEEAMVIVINPLKSFFFLFRLNDPAKLKSLIKSEKEWRVNWFPWSQGSKSVLTQLREVRPWLDQHFKGD